MRYLKFSVFAFIVCITACEFEQSIPEPANKFLIESEVTLNWYDSFGIIHNYAVIDAITSAEEGRLDRLGLVKYIEQEQPYMLQCLKDFHRIPESAFYDGSYKDYILRIDNNMQPFIDVLEEIYAGNLSPQSWRTKIEASYSANPEKLFLGVLSIYSLALHSGINYHENWSLRRTIQSEIAADWNWRKSLAAAGKADLTAALGYVLILEGTGGAAASGVGVAAAGIGLASAFGGMWDAAEQHSDVLNWYIPPSYEGGDEWNPAYEMDYPEIVF